MPVKNLKELFVTMLSAVREGTERTAKVVQEMTQATQSQEVKEALDARVFVKDKILSTLDEVFRLIGEQPVKFSGRLLDVFVEDFRREIAEIQSPEARRLFVLAKASHLAHIRVGEYRILIAAADITGHFGVGVLLESCLADELAFIERGRRLVRSIAEAKIALRAVAS
jgi:ferritin-like metal-binding protein YciE